MKLNVGLFAFLLCGLLSFTSCSDDDDATNGATPNEQIVNAFKKQFPNATEVKWSTRNGYSVASFRLAQNPTGETNEAWYEANGECPLTELEIPSFDQLPAKVQEGYNASIFGQEGWAIDDIDALYRLNMALVFKIEVEKAGQPDYDLLFSEEGVLISAKVDNDDDDDNVPVIIPTAIREFVNQHLSGAELLDYDKEDGELELEVSYQNHLMELYFNTSYKFLRAEEEVQEADLPDAVKTALEQFTAAWEVDDVMLITYADKSVVYAIDLENKTTDQEKIVKIKADGTLIP